MHFYDIACTLAASIGPWSISFYTSASIYAELVHVWCILICGSSSVLFSRYSHHLSLFLEVLLHTIAVKTILFICVWLDINIYGSFSVCDEVLNK